MEARTMPRMPSFHRYRNLSGHSGVVAYALLPEGIALQFFDGMVYLYTHDCPGRRHVSRMKALAREGRGLGTYVLRHVGKRFSARLERGSLQTFTPARAQSSTRENTALR
jgi:hypothetical protein